MEKKSNTLIIGGVILVVIIAAGIGIALMSNKSTTKTNAAAATTSAASTTDTATVNNAVLKTKTSSSFGAYLTEPSGKPLYIYASDSAGKSNCTGSCLTAWPAYVDTGSTTNLPTGVAVITRTDDGAIQFTYKGLPLYTFVSDTGTQPTGNNNGGFTLARP